MLFGVVSYSMFRNSASGPEIRLQGRITAGFLVGRSSKSALRLASASRRDDVDWNPAGIRPGSQISGPEAFLRNIRYLHAVTYYACGTAIVELRGFWVMWTMPLVFMTAQASMKKKPFFTAQDPAEE